jgi:hypothetical protein
MRSYVEKSIEHGLMQECIRPFNRTFHDRKIRRIHMRTGFKMASVLIVSTALSAFAFGFVSSPSAAAASRVGFGFNAQLKGFPKGAVTLTGGGAYDPSAPGASSFVHSGGGFRCTTGVNQGPLAGCADGEGVRWDTVRVLPSFTFKCNGASDTAHTVTTDSDTVVLLADFYRAGDGVNESFSSVPMFVSARDERPDLPGDQRVWIAGVGCGDGEVHFGN